VPKVLITGAAGAFARSCATQFYDAGYTVVLTARSIETHSDWVRVDVTVPEQVRRALVNVRPDMVLHLAATFSTDFNTAFAVNVLGARNILNSIKEVNPKIRLLLIGSAAEYGLFEDDHNPVKEDHVLRPVSVYGLTKAWQTQLGLMSATEGLDVLIARVFNLIGPGMSPRLFVGRVAQQIDEIRSGVRQNLEVGAISAVRDYMSTQNAATMLRSIAERGFKGEIYHVASGVPITIENMLRKMIVEANLDEALIEARVESQFRSSVDVRRIYANIEKTTKLLNVVS
jgi:nucleoside-diphosphate-sugar epimerase